MKNLVIVESPAKAKTINKILGKDFVVKASMGHVRDLPEKELGVDLEKQFKPKYVAIKTREKVLKELKGLAREAEQIYLAPDPDREGEAIAWHLKEALTDKKAPKPFVRVTYNEITAPAIRKAFSEPRDIDQPKVDSQQARRILDRIVGYKVSPLLWRRIRGASSAGRVQSVALRLVCERERAILDFKPEEYWILGARVRKLVDPRDAFSITLAKINGEKAVISSGDQAQRIHADLEGRALRVSAIIRREINRRAPPAFITSTLQQAASSRLGYTPKRTMQLAQKLYEGRDFGDGPVGLITYMRTDSVALSPVAIQAVREFIDKTFGRDYVPDQPNFYRVKADAQAAHEAIRPTDVFRTPEQVAGHLEPDELKLYQLIWERFVACQMASAKIAQRTAEFEAVPPAGRDTTYLFRATTSDVLFPGYMRVAGIEEERRAERKKGEEEEEEPEVKLPPLDEGETVEKLEWTGDRKETQPPPRYTEASLVKALEENGVGRPSTYASIISTIVDRHYVEKDKRALKPTRVGFQVNDFLVHHLPELFDIQFTARMEETLDQIEEGKVTWVSMLGDFYGSFQNWVEKAKGPPADMGQVNGLLEMLAGVREWAPATKRGKRTYSDEAFVQSVREQIAEGEKPITERQLEALLKLAGRYKEQIADFDGWAAKLNLQSQLAEQARAAEPPDEAMKEKIQALAAVPFDPPREVRKRVYDDRIFYGSLRDQVESGRRLTDNQSHHLDRLLQKYAGHVSDYDARAARWGLNTEAVAAADPATGPLVELARSIKDWKAPVQRGKRVWDDREFVDSLSRQFEGKKSLSPRQVMALKKLLRRYAEQVPDYAARATELGLLPRTAARRGGPAEAE
jgi:DNA topoisomerase-1